MCHCEAIKFAWKIHTDSAFRKKFRPEKCAEPVPEYLKSCRGGSIKELVALGDPDTLSIMENLPNEPTSSIFADFAESNF